VGAKWRGRSFCFLSGMGLGILALIFLAYLGLKLFQLNQINRNDCHSVLFGFARSLVYNRAQVAKSLTSPEQWHRVDAWMAEREAIQCSFSLDPDHNQGWLVCSPSLDGGATSPHCSCGFMCPYNDGFYRLSISDAELEKNEDGCLVVDWDKICESGIEGESEKCD
jgi:hypothetical protein